MATASVPNTFVTSTQVDASEWNENFAALVSYLNVNAIVKDGSLAFTALPSLPATSPTLDGHLVRKKYVDDLVRGKNDHTVTYSFVPGGNTDTAVTGVETTWVTLAASLAIPSWAVTAYVEGTVNGSFTTGASATTTLLLKIGALASFGSARVSHVSANTRWPFSLNGECTVSSIAGTSVALVVRANGTGNAIRTDTNGSFVGVVRFFA